MHGFTREVPSEVVEVHQNVDVTVKQRSILQRTRCNGRRNGTPLRHATVVITSACARPLVGHLSVSPVVARVKGEDLAVQGTIVHKYPFEDADEPSYWSLKIIRRIYR